VLVGSSLGAHVCTTAALQLPVRGLFLLAPAFFMPGFEALTPTVPACPVEIVHGWHDDIVPVENTLRWARPSAARVHLLDTEHRMHAVIPELEPLFAAFLARLAR
jgi:predicted esterase